MKLAIRSPDQTLEYQMRVPDGTPRAQVNQAKRQLYDLAHGRVQGAICPGAWKTQALFVDPPNSSESSQPSSSAVLGSWSKLAWDAFLALAYAAWRAVLALCDFLAAPALLCLSIATGAALLWLLIRFVASCVKLMAQ